MVPYLNLLLISQTTMPLKEGTFDPSLMHIAG
jgi:hypothetical protein